ncbi:hypothetical protein ACJQWY_04120 [Weissella kandleri]|uniref:hypothetical protein n=1 Tax=Weissella kandleri TaxID=1616 RepID=UPI00387EBE32
MMLNQLIKVDERQLTESSVLSELFIYQHKFEQITTIQTLLKQIQQVIEALHAGLLPPALPWLEVDDAMVGEVQQNILKRYPTQPTLGNQTWQRALDDLETLDQWLHNFRDCLINNYQMYGYVSTPWLRALQVYLGQRPTLELMAGRGYLTAGLRVLTPNVKHQAVDNLSWQRQPDVHIMPAVTEVEDADALQALAIYAQHSEVLLMSWAPDNATLDVEILKWVRAHYEGEFLVIGEVNGATNSAEFWQTAHLKPLKAINRKFSSFDLIDEKIYRVY